MPWYGNLLTGTSVGGVMAVVCFVCAIGIGLGTIRIRGVSLGIAGVLFVGIVYAHFFWNDEVLRNLTTSGAGARLSTEAIAGRVEALKHSRTEILEFLRELGLVFFVYSIGMQVGPSFFGSLRAQGLRWNALAVSVVALGFFAAWFVVRFGHVPAAAAVGVLSGAVTNTPGLAAAQQALKDMPELAAADRNLPGVGYAVAYPFGVLGTILTMIAARIVFRVDPLHEAERFREESGNKAAPSNANLVVKNPGVAGKRIRDLSGILGAPVIVSRYMRRGQVSLPKADTVMELDDVLHAVGEPHDLEHLHALVGEASPIDIRNMSKNLAARRLIVTRADVVGKTLAELNFRAAYGVNITRVARAGIEFVPSSAYNLHYGDTLVAVGDADGLAAAEAVVGNSMRQLQTPQLIPLFIGIVAGLVLGSIPFAISGLPAPVKLGLAGGPLVAALFFSAVGHVGKISFYVPQSANAMLRELGIALFLGCVGLTAGGQFLRTLREGDGWYWMAMGAVITLGPLLAAAVVGRLVMKVNYTALCGILAGSMTDPPALAFANSLAQGEGAAIAYGTVYPVTMVLRILSAQLFVILFTGHGW